MNDNGQPRALLVGFEDQDNLGLRYLASRLREAGGAARLVSGSPQTGQVLNAIASFRPHLVGFSLIYQFLGPQFATLLAELREAGTTTHFTMGGHYPSFEPQALLDAIPQLDSVVRFEGEDTLVELVRRLAAAEPWHDIPGIAYRGPAGTVLTLTRPGRRDLDSLPWPDRDDIDYHSQLLPTASAIGGRGCPWQCSFCSIINFYTGNGTRGRRLRDPTQVVDELEYLHRDRGVRVILWQDDDFLAPGRQGVTWAHQVAKECVRRGLQQDLRWKISCRSDEVTAEALEPLVEAGLTHVYLGVESGTETGLEHLNKHLTPDAHLAAGETLRSLQLSFDFGFMLLEPWSTFASVRENLRFLDTFVGDGASAIGFGRALPYAGTAMARKLMQEGRLIVNGFESDYHFLDPRLDAFYDWLLGTLSARHTSDAGMGSILRLLLFEAALHLPDRPRNDAFLDRARQLTSIANRLLLSVTGAALDYFQSLPASATAGFGADPLLAQLHGIALAEEARLYRDLVNLTRLHPALQNRLGILNQI